MSRRKLIPFQRNAKQEIATIGNPEISYIHLLKRGGLTPNESPTDIQEQQRNQAKIQRIFYKAVEKLSKEKGISRTEATTLLSAAPVKEEGDEKVTVESGINFYDYLEANELEEFLSLQNRLALPIKATTLMIRYRLAYDFQLVEAVEEGDKTIKIRPDYFADLRKGDRISFDGNLVTILGITPVADGDEYQALSIKAADCAIAAESVGYLCKEGSSQYLIGDDEWTEELTKTYLHDQQIEAVYTFYQAEAGELALVEGAKDEAEDSEGN